MFEHSLPVPRLYKAAAKIVENVTKNGVSVKNLVYQTKHPNTKALFALVVETLKHSKQLEFLFKRTKLFENEPRFNPWLARVLITELLWGKKRLSGESKPVKTILAYQQVLIAHTTDVHESSSKEKKVIKPRFVRVNTILTTVKDVISGFRDEGWIFIRYMDTKNYNNFLEKVADLAENEFMVDINIPELLIFPPNTEFYAHDAYKNGLIVLQDKASCLPVHLLNPLPGTRVLDMCAAPGMKTSQIAAALNNNGNIYAVDVDAQRLKTLETLMEKLGITCVHTINEDVLQITNKNYPEIEYILVDPSCSGSGIVDRPEFNEPAMKDERRIAKLKGFQIMILKHALKRFPNAKRVIYSTCSIYPEENEEVVKEVLSQTAHFKLISGLDLLHGLWCSVGSEKYGDIGKFCLYSRPHMDGTNGFFVAVFERLNVGEQNEYFVQNPAHQSINLQKNLSENEKQIKNKNKRKINEFTAKNENQRRNLITEKEKESKRDNNKETKCKSKSTQDIKNRENIDNQPIEIDFNNINRKILKEDENEEHEEITTNSTKRSKNKNYIAKNLKNITETPTNFEINQDHNLEDISVKRKKSKKSKLHGNVEEILIDNCSTKHSNKKYKLDIDENEDNLLKETTNSITNYDVIKLKSKCNIIEFSTENSKSSEEHTKKKIKFTEGVKKGLNNYSELEFKNKEDDQIPVEDNLKCNKKPFRKNDCTKNISKQCNIKQETDLSDFKERRFEQISNSRKKKLKLNNNKIAVENVEYNKKQKKDIEDTNEQIYELTKKLENHTNKYTNESSKLDTSEIKNVLNNPNLELSKKQRKKKHHDNSSKKYEFIEKTEEELSDCNKKISELETCTTRSKKKKHNRDIIQKEYNPTNVTEESVNDCTNNMPSKSKIKKVIESDHKIRKIITKFNAKGDEEELHNLSDAKKASETTINFNVATQIKKQKRSLDDNVIEEVTPKKRKKKNHDKNINTEESNVKQKHKKKSINILENIVLVTAKKNFL